MRKRLKLVQRLVAITSILAFLLVAAYFLVQRLQGSSFIDTRGQPSFGNPSSSKELIIFEDFRCSNCQHFMRTSFPNLKRNYVDTGKIHLVIIPVAFIEGSKELSNAALCVYSFDKESFFPFVHKATLLPYPEESDYLKMASKLENGLSIQSCIKSHKYFSKLDQNFTLGEKVMKGHLRTPSLYVNGKRLPNYSYETLTHYLESAE